MKHRLPVVMSILVIGLIGLTAACGPVEGAIVTIPRGDGIPAYQFPNQIKETCRLPDNQYILVTRETYFTEYTGNSTSETMFLGEVAALQRGDCNSPGGVFVENKVISSGLATVTDPEKQKEITQRLCDGGAMGTAEETELVKRAREVGLNAPLTEFEEFCQPQTKK